MNIKQTIRNVLAAVLFVASVGGVSLLSASPVSAETCPNGGDPNNNCSTSGTADPSDNKSEDGCAGVATSIIKCDTSGKEGIEGTGIWALLLMAINILTAGVGVAALGGIVYGSVLYTAAGGNPEQVKKARGILKDVAIGVVAFAGMYALLNFIIPGGIFS